MCRGRASPNELTQIMQHNEFVSGFINQAREEIEDAAELYPREIALLKRLITAVDSQSDAELAQTVAQLKAEVDALSWPVHTILPTLVDMLADEFSGKQNQVQCSICGGMIPMIEMDHRFLGRYTCPHCGGEVLLSDD
jgi:hypothetical protein